MNTELFDSSSAYLIQVITDLTHKLQDIIFYMQTLGINLAQMLLIELMIYVINKNGSAILGARNNNRDYATAGVSGIYVQANGSSDCICR